MILLKDILYKVTIESVVGSTSVAINNLEFDSRNVSLNDVFIAIKGTVSDGHQFIKKLPIKVPWPLFAKPCRKISSTELPMCRLRIRTRHWR